MIFMEIKIKKENPKNNDISNNYIFLTDFKQKVKK
jgi:hypothetical protein